MIGVFDAFARPLLAAMDAEAAHRATVLGLKYAPLPKSGPDDPRLAQTVFGLAFPNPVGMAAGFDKGAEAPDALLSLGFGFVEIGTVTPRPQPGNPRPRLFRLPADRGVVNRFGFNSEGHAAVRARLVARKNRAGRRRGILGVNIGANKDAADRLADYAAGITAFADLADYFTVNVSSPNTPGLRDLQQARTLRELLARVLEARETSVAAGGARRPVLLKIAPDLELADLDDVVRVALESGIDGMIVSNTTIARDPALRDPKAKEAGGLSGRPVFDLSTRMLRETFRRVEGRLPLVGVGGVDSPAAAIAKFEAGASLIQLYSSLAYEGIGLVGRIKAGLLDHLRREGLDNIGRLTGRGA